MKKLYIAHVDDHLTWRGGQRQVIELIKGLNERHHRNVLICKATSELSKRARDAGINVVNLPLSSELDIVSALKIRQLIKRNKIDILHAHTSHAHTICLFAHLNIASCKLVVSRRVDFHLHNFFSRHIKYGPLVNKIIAVSDAIKRILIEDGVDEERIVTIRSGFVQCYPYQFAHSVNIREKLGISADTVVIVTVAALAPHKAHHVLMKAVNLVRQKYPKVIFLCAGEGEMRPTLERMITSLQLQSSVKLLGFVEDIGSIFQSADIFALSSDEEGLCTSLLDAMYFGLPIIATSAGGIPELVQDGVNGLIVPVGDHTLFAEKLIHLIENPERRKVMGLRSSELLKENMVDRTIEKTEEVYYNLFEQ